MFSLSNKSKLESLFAAARTGDQDALGRLTELCRPYLLRVAGDELNPGLRAKFGASDLVQQALIEGQQSFIKFTGSSKDELLAWMRQILRNNLIDESRKYLETAVRNIKREFSLDGERGAILRQELEGEQRSTLDDLAGLETKAVLEHCLRQLPLEFQQVIQLRHVDELCFARIGEVLDKSEDAARKTWYRALRQLRQDLKTHEEFGSSYR